MTPLLLFRFMYALFVGILIWEELWDLPHTAALSSWLLLLITSGAVVTSLIYERRLWCKVRIVTDIPTQILWIDRVHAVPDLSGSQLERSITRKFTGLWKSLNRGPDARERVLKC